MHIITTINSIILTILTSLSADYYNHRIQTLTPCYDDVDSFKYFFFILLAIPVIIVGGGGGVALVVVHVVVWLLLLVFLLFNQLLSTPNLPAQGLHGGRLYDFIYVASHPRPPLSQSVHRLSIFPSQHALFCSILPFSADWMSFLGADIICVCLCLCYSYKCYYAHLICRNYYWLYRIEGMKYYLFSVQILYFYHLYHGVYRYNIGCGV